MTAPADSSSPPAVRIPVRTVAKVVFGTAGVVWILGVLARLWVLHGGLEGWLYYTPNRYFDLDREQSVPAWFSTVLLLGCAAATATAGALDRSAAGRPASAAGRPSTPREGWFWWVLTAAFVYLSVDEMTSIHESLGTSVAREVTGELGEQVLFTWVLLAVPLVGLFAAASVPFLRRLPWATTVRFVISGALFVGGAVGVEMAASGVAEEGGLLSLPYSLLVFAEEGLEMAGASLFLVSILKHVQDRFGVLEVRCAPTTPGDAAG